LLLLAAAAGGAWWMRKPNADVNRPLLIVISGDTAGWIVPCGCTSNQSGGLLRRGTHLEQLRERASVIVADAGGAPGGMSPYHQVKFEAILKGEKEMGLAAHNLGGPEAAFGADTLRRIARELDVPFVSANLRDAAGKPVAEPCRIVEQAGRRIAFVGVLARSYARDGLQIDDPREAVLRTLGEMRGKYDSAIVLAYLPEEELQQLAAGLPEVDAVVGGPTGQSIQPRPVGPTLLAAATNKGKFLVHLESARSKAAWTGRVVEMDKDIADDPAQQANVRAYLDELGRRDFPASASGFAPALPTSVPTDYRVLGNQSCVECHKNDCALWAQSKHGHAWQTLTERGYHVDSYCQQCHTTGFGLPGGFESIARSTALRSVGCESCHGPSQGHARNPKVKTSFAAKDQCASCHDHENSPNFDYATYWPRIQHGKR
jgi:hypothetical protein